MNINNDSLNCFTNLWILVFSSVVTGLLVYYHWEAMLVTYLATRFDYLMQIHITIKKMNPIVTYTLNYYTNCN